MFWARSLFFNICFFLWTMALAPSLAVAYVAPKSVVWAMSLFWVRGLLWMLKKIVGIDHEVRGLEHVQAGSAIYASKHQSAWETLALCTLIPNPAFILKKELLKIPFFGNYLKLLEMIAIDRKQGEKALKLMVKQALKLANQGRSIIIFPEGTRVPVREKRKLKKRGIATLYSKLPVPVVPVAHNSGVFWSRNSFLKKPGTIIVEFLPPIAPGLEENVFIERLTQSIETTTDQLVEEGIATLPPSLRV